MCLNKKAQYDSLLKTQAFFDIMNTLEQLTINDNNALKNKDEFTNLFNSFFDELNKCTKDFVNKKDLWLIFDLPQIRTICLQYLLPFYYQRDKDLTDLFIQKINDFFEPIEDENDKKDAQICALINVKKRFHSLTIHILWHESNKQAFFYTRKLATTNEEKKCIPWYNILPQNHDAFNTTGITYHDTMKFTTEYSNYINSQDPKPSLEITFMPATQYANILYVYTHKNQNLTIESLYYDQEKLACKKISAYLASRHSDSSSSSDDDVPNLTQLNDTDPKKPKEISSNKTLTNPHEQSSEPKQEITNTTHPNTVTIEELPYSDKAENEKPLTPTKISNKYSSLKSKLFFYRIRFANFVGQHIIKKPLKIVAVTIGICSIILYIFIKAQKKYILKHAL
jgi:hypothetical protein